MFPNGQQSLTQMNFVKTDIVNESRGAAPRQKQQTLTQMNVVTVTRRSPRVVQTVVPARQKQLRITQIFHRDRWSFLARSDKARLYGQPSKIRKVLSKKKKKKAVGQTQMQRVQQRIAQLPLRPAMCPFEASLDHSQIRREIKERNEKRKIEQREWLDYQARCVS